MRILSSSRTACDVQVAEYVPPTEPMAREAQPQARELLPQAGKASAQAGEASLLAGERQDQGLPDDADGCLEDAAGRILAQAERKAHAILQEASAEAEAIREQASGEASRRRKEAYDVGYGKGYQEGIARGEQEARDWIDRELGEQLEAFRRDAAKALESIETAKEHCLHAYLDELKDCAVAVGEKVIHISLKSSGEVIKQMIIAATEKLKKAAWVKIYIDKFDYEMMMWAGTDVIDELSGLSDNIKFIVMDKEEQGNCIIEMPESIVDASVNTQMENIRDILENVRI